MEYFSISELLEEEHVLSVAFDWSDTKNELMWYNKLP